MFWIETEANVANTPVFDIRIVKLWWIPAVSYHLADAGITGQDVGVLNDGQSWRSGGGDLQHTAPLGEVSTVLLVLGATLIQTIETCDKKDGITSG